MNADTVISMLKSGIERLSTEPDRHNTRSDGHPGTDGSAGPQLKPPGPALHSGMTPVQHRRPNHRAAERKRRPTRNGGAGDERVAFATVEAAGRTRVCWSWAGVYAVARAALIPAEHRAYVLRDPPDSDARW